MTLMDRFMAYVSPEPNSGCWLWLGNIHKPTGYGRIGDKDTVLYAHRVAYESFKGPLPEGRVVDHLCRVRECVNPDHLRAVTIAENVMAPGSRGIGAVNARKPDCKRGHPLELRPDGYRRCMTCDRERDRLRNKTPERLERAREYKRRKRAEAKSV